MLGISFSLSSVDINVKKISVICKNCGPNGYNSGSENCNENSGIYNYEFKGPGYGKIQFYKPLLENKNIKTVLDSATSLVNLNKSIVKDLIINDYKLKLDIQDKYNYSYEITKK